ncbi:BON domain-containing protein [Wenzhouxiangella limi]|uniref:BON domain-containing protein n=1 Tax=Wenzhouxiangella limi TaxID=2707351 RepID=A0A845V9J2_9GAMM|nr:BON domain-containing protein [Wenzhouxiangella limi]NDY96585.1 BON domain-containing protein [Wenzhouxiangella limi]
MSDVSSKIKAALEREPEVKSDVDEINVVENDVIRLQGVVTTLGAKRRALRVAMETTEHGLVADGLRLRPQQQRGDDQIAATLDQALRGEVEFQGITIDTADALAEEPDGQCIMYSVDDGVVRLDGVVESLSHRRLAEVLAWWTPGITEVDNRLRVKPAQEENDGELAEALEMVFSKDPALRNHEINALVRDRQVHLGGRVASEAQKQRASADCWCLPGVHEVRNELQVFPTA